MSIGIIKAIKTILSDKYNKGNFGLFILFLIIAIITLLIISLFTIKSSQVISFTIMITGSILLTLFQIGFYAKSTNNAIKLRKTIFPNPFKNFLNLIEIGGKYLIGVFCIILLYCVPPALIMLIGFGLSTIMSPIIATIVCIIPYAIFLYYSMCLLCTADLTFTNSLKLSAFFGFQKTFKKFKENKKIILSLIGKRITLSLIIFLITFIPTLILGAMIASKEANSLIQSILNLVQSILSIIASIIFIELNGQAGRLVFFEENKIEREKKLAQRQNAQVNEQKKVD